MTLGWWQWLPIHLWRIASTVPSADEIREKPLKRTESLVGTRHPKWIAFDCPRRSGHPVMLNADPGGHPVWTLKLPGAGVFTIFPSAIFTEGDRRCYLIVRAGRIVWVRDSIP